jgi:Glycosyl transferases group 1
MSVLLMEPTPWDIDIERAYAIGNARRCAMQSDLAKLAVVQMNSLARSSSGLKLEMTESDSRTRIAELTRRSGRPLKIVEIGDKPFIKSAFPEETIFFSTYAVAPTTDRSTKTFNISLFTIAELRRLLADESVCLIVCHPTFSSPWSPRAISRAVFSRRLFRGHLPLIRAFGPQFLRGKHSAPVVILDQDDFPLINRWNLFLLKKCALYFKRELPVDRWRVFLKTVHRHLPTYRFRRKRQYEDMIEKLRPISLGLPLGHPEKFPSGVSKTSDVFFAGRTEGSSWVRKTGVEELSKLKQQGINVDFVQGTVARDEFYFRCASSWLTWSPEGYGWDCFRHYEALACGSVPLSNYPTIERHRPLIDGQHAIFYSSDAGSLGPAVGAALADKARLERLAANGRSFVLQHHTPQSLAEYVVEQGLSVRGGASAL